MTFIEFENGVHTHIVILDYSSVISRGSVLLVEVTIVLGKPSRKSLVHK